MGVEVLLPKLGFSQIIAQVGETYEVATVIGMIE
jgi:hypothetical protein